MAATEERLGPDADGEALAVAMRAEADAIALRMQADLDAIADHLAAVLEEQRTAVAEREPERPLGVLIHGDPGSLWGGLVGPGVAALSRLAESGRPARVVRHRGSSVHGGRAAGRVGAAPGRHRRTSSSRMRRSRGSSTGSRSTSSSSRPRRSRRTGTSPRSWAAVASRSSRRRLGRGRRSAARGWSSSRRARRSTSTRPTAAPCPRNADPPVSCRATSGRSRSRAPTR